MLKISKLARFLRISPYDHILLSSESFIITDSKSIQTAIPLTDISNFNLESGFLWNTFELTLTNETTYSISGLSKSQSQIFAENFEDTFREHYYTNQYDKAKEIEHRLPNLDTYLQTKELTTLVLLVKEKMPKFKYRTEKPTSLNQEILFDKIIALKKRSLYFQENHNRLFMIKELTQYDDFFNSIEKKPLTQMQREAVIINEQSNLIIAGAGSGKTSVMVARVGYVIQKYKIKPEEILLVAFNKTAAQELQERIQDRLKIKDIKTSTFHSLGLEIIGKAEGLKPSVAPWASNQKEKEKLIDSLMLELAKKDIAFKNTLLNFFAHPFSAYKSEFEFKSEIEYKQYIRNNKIIALKGHEVKSYEECEIANFLFLNQVAYEYEITYEHTTATSEYTQYQPDFYLTDYNLYYEHFGVDRKGNTAPYVDKVKYNEGITWKRSLHKENNTELIETYSYQSREGHLLLELQLLLEKKGVNLEPMSLDDALVHLNRSGLISDFSKIISIFISHFKSNKHSVSSIRDRARQEERLNAFIDIFEPIMDAYEAHNKSKNMIDFEDMINMAIEHINNNLYSSPYKCILVDEYQDISIGRAHLVQALHKQVEDASLTVVGDDWQSIYRFAGSDISLFHNFEKFFGHSASVKLDYTFRFNDKISSVSQKFIEQNPNQISKDIKTLSKVNAPKVHVWWGDDKDMNKIEELIHNFISYTNKKTFSIFILARNKIAMPDNIKSIHNKFPNIDIKVQTIHSSKGLEADFVIIPGVTSGKYGFPSSIEDDPILDIVLAKQENFTFAEERRLFYVALTRAKEEVHILASNYEVSPFAKELEEPLYLVEHHYINNIKPQVCPSCKLGTLILRSSGNGKKFFGCSNYNIYNCGFTAPAYSCAKCSHGTMQLDKYERVYNCSNAECVHKERACPSCKGKLVKRYGKNNHPFFGCSNYSSKGCRHTETIS